MKTSARESLFKLATLLTLLKKTSPQALSDESCGVSKNSYFVEHQRTATSEIYLPTGKTLYGISSVAMYYSLICL